MSQSPDPVRSAGYGRLARAEQQRSSAAGQQHATGERGDKRTRRQRRRLALRLQPMFRPRQDVFLQRRRQLDEHRREPPHPHDERLVLRRIRVLAGQQ